MIELLIDKIIEIVSAIGYLGVFFLMALESTMFPIPSEGVMPFAGFLIAQGTMNFWFALIASTFGCLIGSMTSYLVGYYGGYPFIRKFGKYFLINEEHMKKAEEWFKHKGKITIFTCRFVPGVRHVISIPAGAAKMDLWHFSLYTILGAGIWNAILLYAGFVLEKNWRMVEKYTSYLDMLVIFVIAAAIIYYIFYIINDKRLKKQKY